MNYIQELKKINACTNAVKWSKDYLTFKDAWEKCERADWMLWIAGKLCKTEKRRKEIILTACICARRSLKYIPKEDKRPLKAIQMAEKWAKNIKDVTLQDVKNAADVAAADAAAVYAAAAANAIAYATVAAAVDAADVAAAAAADDDDAVKTKELKIMSNIVRKYLSIPKFIIK